MSCAARRQLDQMACGPCGTAWDVNDPEPPACGLECVGAADRVYDPDAMLTNIHAMRGGSGAFLIGSDIIDTEFDDAGWAPTPSPDYEMDNA